MSNTSRSKDCVKLRRLLALKRHELPPPGYFNTFHHEVVEKIEAMEARGPWWTRLMDAVVLRPTLAAGFAAVALGFYAVGLAPRSPLDQVDVSAGRVLSGSVNAFQNPTLPAEGGVRLVSVAPRAMKPVISPLPALGSPWLIPLGPPTEDEFDAAPANSPQTDRPRPTTFSVVD